MKVKSIVQRRLTGKVLNLFAGKNKLDYKDIIYVDSSSEFDPDYNMNAKDYLLMVKKETFDTIIYDPPWNERKSKELYNGRYIGQFTKMKNNIISILKARGKVISLGYEISNFGKIRGMQLEELVVVNPFGEIRPYFISIERKIQNKKLELLL